MQSIADLLSLGSRWTLVGGKGGVGKTTTAAALALALADRGERALVLSVDPAHSLGDALGVALGPEPRPVPGLPGLSALEVDAERERERFLGSRRGALLRLLERGTYLDREDIEGLVDLAVPGMDELAALFWLMDQPTEGGPYLIVDTAPTGHTLRLLDLPQMARAWLGALQVMEEKHRAVALALAGAYREDEAGRLLAELDAELTRFSALLTDPARTRFALVTTPQPVVLAETRRYQESLTARGIALAGIVVNRSGPAVSPAAVGAGMVFVPSLEPDPTGIDGLRSFATSARADPAPSHSGHQSSVVGLSFGLTTDDRRPTTVSVGGPFHPPLDRRLYIVGGKGGVGKSTAASALAIRLAGEMPGGVLLLSTDPAGSLGDVLQQVVGSEPRPVAGVTGLDVQQVDAPAAWATFREHYRAEAERLFAGLLSGGLSAAADRRVVERLIDLAPPGIDELVALLQVVDLTEDRPYDALVLDTAPTGHLLRLLELPGLALDWTHGLLRLLLKYREVVGLGELAEEVLSLAHQLRDLRARLMDPRQTWFLVVALPEALSVPETRRLLSRLRALGMTPGALLLNRLSDAEGAPAGEPGSGVAALLEAAAELPCAGAPAWPEGPAGPGSLLRFAHEWRAIQRREE